MINANAVTGHLPVEQSDFTNQRFLPFIFTPCTDDSHDEVTEQA
jgi:hypothetical protein